MQITNVQGVETLFSFDTVGGLSSMRNEATIGSGGSVSTASSELIISSGVNNAATTWIATTRRASATPGCDVFTQMGLRTATASPSGSQVALWGLFDNNEGYGFGINSTSLFTFVKTGGTITATPQANWNVDTLDGTGPSRLAMNSVLNGIYFNLRSTWYGGIEYSIARPSAGLERINVHHVKTAQPMYLTSYLPIRVEVQNNSTTGNNFQVLLSVGRVSETANGTATSRIVSQDHLNLSCPQSVNTPVVSVMPVGNTNVTSIPVRLDSLEVLTDQPLVIYGVYGGQLTSPSWSAPSGIQAGESMCQVDTTHAQNSFNVMCKSIVPSGFTVYNFDSQLPYPTPSNPFTVYAKPIGTTDATASFNLRWREQW